MLKFQAKIAFFQKNFEFKKKKLFGQKTEKIDDQKWNKSQNSVKSATPLFFKEIFSSF